ncbi:MAG: ABC transporter ATP-binding protein [Hyphomicrobiales bacterium]|nr:ABC transporter ATP-binding protein [Hyphomicrobiales bacterium]MCP5374180.1 ABC transporter ATP-binding protein [Hyphomicrobiales bacterium]
MSQSVLHLSGVVKRFGETLAVGPVGFEVQEGEFLTLLGPSGCGKTTTLHIVAGLLYPDQGEVRLRGREITRLDPQHRDMGLVFQNYALFPHKTVFDNVAFGLRMRKVAAGEIRERVLRMLDVVGLPGVENRQPHQLSGGQRQRVALARALVIEPSLLLLDEPLSNLDAVLRKRMRLELRDIQQRLGIATIFVTHDQDEAFEMSDRVILMNVGHIEQVATPEELYDNPTSRFAAEFIGEVNLIDGTVAGVDGGAAQVQSAIGGRYRARGDLASVRAGDEVLLMVRPERVEIEPDAAAADGLVPATVAKRVFSGDLLIFTLRTADGTELTASKPSTQRYRAIAPDSSVWIDLGECRLLPRGA